MNILVVVAVVAVLGLLRFRRTSLLMWAGAWWVGMYVLLRFGFSAPIPSSVITLYMGIVSLAIAAYVTSTQENRDEVSSTLIRFMTEKRYTPLLAAAVIGIPALAAANVYVKMNVPLQPPLFSRTVHPASPAEITVHDKKIDLNAAENPFLSLERSNTEEFRKHVEAGRKTYYRNCVFCHGDDLSGNGMFVHGLDPIPTNFTDGSIAGLRDSFLLLAHLQGRARAARGGRAVGLGDARLGEVPVRRGDVGGDPLPLRLHRPEAARQGGRAPMSARLISRGCARPADRRGMPGLDAVDAGAGARRRHRGAARVGQAAVRKVLRAVPRREGRRRGRRDAAPVPEAAQLHHRQVQGADDSQRLAADASGPGQHHQARHAVHVDAGLAQSRRPGRGQPRLLHHDVLARLHQRRAESASRSRCRARRRPARRRSPRARSCTKRPAAPAVTAISVAATAPRRRRSRTTSITRSVPPT